jgi:FdrA protein
MILKPLVPGLAYGDESALRRGKSCLLDFGDDQYTQGRPHPMIDPAGRSENMLRLASDRRMDVVLFDIVLGRCSHSDPAGEFVKTMERLRRSPAGGKAVFVGAVAGVDEDIQNRRKQVETLRRAGAVVMPDNAQAAKLAALLTRLELRDTFKPIAGPAAGSAVAASVAVSRLFPEPFAAINIGVDIFADSLAEQGMKVRSLDWRPPISREVEEAILCLPALRD